MKYRFRIETYDDGEHIVQQITYRHSLWSDRQLRLMLLRKKIEIETKLDAEVKKIFNSGNTCAVFYDKSSNIDNIARYDGDWFITYNKPKKSCKSCISYTPDRKCTWKDEFLIKPITGCDGFLEK